MGLDSLKTRIDYCGGSNQQQRMIVGKERSLKKALLYSYQAETAVLKDGREFRCLINPDKLKVDYDGKILTMPFRDVCLNKPRAGKTSQNLEKVGIRAGDVFKWKETDTYWLVYLQHLEESAYFKGEIYKCQQEPVIINGQSYYIYLRGPVETTIQWNQRKEMTWNDINYSLVCYITRDENTLDYFHRFKQIKIDGKNWEVKTVNPYAADGIIKLCLGEFFNNDMNDHYQELESKKDEQAPPQEIFISGENRVYPYETYEYVIYGINDGEWTIDNTKKAKIKKQNSDSVTIEIISGKSGKFRLEYKNKDCTASLPIEIKSI